MGNDSVGHLMRNMGGNWCERFCLVELENGVGLVIEWCEWVYSFFWFVFSPSV